MRRTRPSCVITSTLFTERLIGSAWFRSYSILCEMQLPILHKVGLCRLPWNGLMPTISHWLLQIQALVFQMMTWNAFLSVSIVAIPRGREHPVGLGWDSLLCATWSMLWEDRLRLRVRLARGAVSVCCCVLLCRGMMRL